MCAKCWLSAIFKFKYSNSLLIIQENLICKRLLWHFWISWFKNKVKKVKRQGYKKVIKIKYLQLLEVIFFFCWVITSLNELINIHCTVLYCKQGKLYLKNGDSIYISHEFYQGTNLQTLRRKVGRLVRHNGGFRIANTTFEDSLLVP